MFERELTKDLSGVGRIIPTKLGISRPTLTPKHLSLSNPTRASSPSKAFFLNLRVFIKR